MKPTLIAALCVALLLPTLAQADLEPGTYAPDIEAKDWINADEGPISLSELRGMVVVLYFWVSWSRGGEYFMPLINLVENRPNIGRGAGVFLMGVTEADRKRVLDVVKEERILFPIALESTAAKEYKIESFPRVVVIDPNGKVAFTGLFGKSDEDNFIKKITDVLAETPPTRTHPREVVEAYHDLDRAREAIRRGDFRLGFQAARNAVEHALTGDPLKVLCQNMIDVVEAIGRDKLADALRLVDEKKYAEAVAVLRDVDRLFRGMAAGKTAKKRLEALKERYPEVKRVLDGLQREAEARGLLVSAKDALWDRSFGQAYDTLEKIVRDYSDTRVVGDVKTILQRMEKNQAIMGYVRDHQGEKDSNNWLGQARSYIRTGNLDKAKELLRKVIKTYPDTIWAEQAYRELSQLP
jgi:tetratricopeptide (TPR) repeat protein